MSESDVPKWLGKYEDDWRKTALAGVNAEVNGLKAEVTALTGSVKGLEASATWAKAEITGASAGLKLFNAERAIFDVERMREQREERQEQARLAAGRMRPEDLRRSITALEQEVSRQINGLKNRTALLRRSLTQATVRARQDRNTAVAAKSTAERALRTARDGVRKAEAALRRQRAASRAAPGRGPQPPQRVDRSSIEQAARAVRDLENRVRGLERALG